MHSKFPDRSFPLLCFAGVFLFGLWGILTICSAQSEAAQPLHLAIKQGGFLLFSLAVMLVAGKLPFSLWNRFRRGMLLGAWGILLLLPFFGIQVNGMRGWFVCGPFYWQPSEILKFAYLISLVNALCDLPPKRRFTGTLALTLFWTLPILMQPDFGTAAVCWGIWSSLYFLAGGRLRDLAIAALAGAAGAAVFLLRNPYAWGRIIGFFYQQEELQNRAWHILQFKMAIARGGWFGEKMGGALWSNSYLPFSYNDSAFASLCETLGVCGAGLLLLLLAAFLLLFLCRASRIRAPKAQLTVAAAGVALAVQTLLHLLVNTALLPTTGIPMPFLSYGGSSLLGSCLLIAAAISASRSEENGENEQAEDGTGRQ